MSLPAVRGPPVSNLYRSALTVAAALCTSGPSRPQMRAYRRHAFLSTPPTARRMFGSGSLRARGRANTDHTGTSLPGTPTASGGLNSGTPSYPGPGFPLTSCILNSAQGLRKSSPLDSKTLPNRSHSWGGGGIGSGVHPRGHHPGHPFIQDPAMPPLPPPNTLAQLEEACRRLEEVSKPPKQR